MQIIIVIIINGEVLQNNWLPMSTSKQSQITVNKESLTKGLQQRNDWSEV